MVLKLPPKPATDSQRRRGRSPTVVTTHCTARHTGQSGPRCRSDWSGTVSVPRLSRHALTGLPRPRVRCGDRAPCGPRRPWSFARRLLAARARRLRAQVVLDGTLGPAGPLAGPERHRPRVRRARPSAPTSSTASPASTSPPASRSRSPARARAKRPRPRHRRLAVEHQRRAPLRHPRRRPVPDQPRRRRLRPGRGAGGPRLVRRHVRRLRPARHATGGSTRACRRKACSTTSRPAAFGFAGGRRRARSHVTRQPRRRRRPLGHRRRRRRAASSAARSSPRPARSTSPPRGG